MSEFSRSGESSSTLKVIEKEPLTPEKHDRKLGFLRFVPVTVMERIMRKKLAGLRQGAPPGAIPLKREVKTSDYNIQGYNGEIAVRLFMPENTAKRAVTVFFHGGAFIGGRMDCTDHYCAAYADKTGESVLSVEYRLAPEYPFPHGLEDCYAACKWVAENLGTDTGKITVSGESAGGNFAAAIGLMAQERKEFSISRLILIYPYTTFMSPKLSMTKVMHKWYLNGADRANPYISPLEGELRGLPPTLTVICEYDLLAGSGKVFAQKLADNGVDSTCAIFKKTNHGFLDRTDSLKQTEELLDLISKWKNG